MADSSFIATIYTKVTKVFVDNVDIYAGKIAGQAKPVIAAAFLLYMLYVVYRMYSKKDALWEEFTNKIILFAIVGTFAAVGEHYSNVISFVLNAGDEIASSLLDAHTQIHKHTALSPTGLRPQPVDIHPPNAGNTHKKPIEAQSLDA